MARPLTITLICLTALTVAALVYLERIGLPSAAAGAKLAASAGFVATAVSAGAAGSRFGRLLLAGLMLSWCGDAILLGESRRAFLAGLGTFLAAHVAYIAAFLHFGIAARRALYAAVPAAAAAIAVGAWLAPHMPAGLALPVHLYTAVITLMVVAAIGAWGAGAPGLVAAGALLFFGSDVSVAAERIVGTAFPTPVWGLPMYYAGQLCLAAASGAQPQSGQSSSQ